MWPNDYTGSSQIKQSFSFLLQNVQISFVIYIYTTFADQEIVDTVGRLLWWPHVKTFPPHLTPITVFADVSCNGGCASLRYGMLWAKPLATSESGVYYLHSTYLILMLKNCVCVCVSRQQWFNGKWRVNHLKNITCCEKYPELISRAIKMCQLALAVNYMCSSISADRRQVQSVLNGEQWVSRGHSSCGDDKCGKEGEWS